MKRFLLLALFMILPAISYAQSQSQGLQVNVPCRTDQLGPGQLTNDAVVSAINTLLAPNWINNNEGRAVIARFGDMMQARFSVAGGVLFPQTGGSCTPQDTSLWNGWNQSNSGNITEPPGEDWNGNGIIGDIIGALSGWFNSGSTGDGLDPNHF
jgi:hypothetical protein